MPLLATQSTILQEDIVQEVLKLLLPFGAVFVAVAVIGDESSPPGQQRGPMEVHEFLKRGLFSGSQPQEIELCRC